MENSFLTHPPAPDNTAIKAINVKILDLKLFMPTKLTNLIHLSKFQSCPCSMRWAIRSIVASSLLLSGWKPDFMFMPKNLPNVCQKPALKLPRKAFTILNELWSVSLLMSLRRIFPWFFVMCLTTGLYCSKMSFSSLFRCFSRVFSSGMVCMYSYVSQSVENASFAQGSVFLTSRTVRQQNSSCFLFLNFIGGQTQKSLKIVILTMSPYSSTKRQKPLTGFIVIRMSLSYSGISGACTGVSALLPNTAAANRSVNMNLDIFTS